MYASGLSYSRLRPTYDDKERTIGPTTYGWHTNFWPDRTASTSSRNNVNSNRDSGSMASSQQNSTPARRNRYARASTTSVTQLLSDSCSSLLQRLTTRVRGPSATFDRSTQKSATTANIPSLNSTSNNTSSTVPSSLGTSSKNKFEDKYTYVLDRIYGRRKDHDKTLEPSVGRTLTKSATTSNVLLSEKAYPYVSNNVPFREKTPYRSETRVPQQHYHHHHHHVPVEYPEPPYTYLNRDSVYRLRHRSNHSELRPRRSSKPQRTGKSEASDKKSPITKLYPVEIPLSDDGPVPVHAPTSKTNIGVPAVSSDDETTPTPGGVVHPDPVSEREAKRKEIQSLIMKYSALDEAYNRTNATAAPTSAAAAIAQKYYPRLTATAVSNGRV